MKKQPALLIVLIVTMFALMGCTSAENTPEPQTNPDTAASNLVITAAQLTATMEADRVEYSGVCPMSLQFEGTIYSQGQGNLTYQLRADSNDPNYEFTLPEPQTVDNPTEGEHELEVTDSLEVSESVEGWVYLYVFEPMEFSSNNVDISINCE